MSKHTIWAQYTKDGKVVSTIRRETDFKETAEITWMTVGAQIDEMGWVDELMRERSQSLTSKVKTE